MKSVHMTLQGKGGVGKSLVAALIAQFLQERGDEATCIDTDPVNQTFTGYSALKVSTLPLLDAEGRVNERNFDPLIEQIVETDSAFVIDNGAASFVPLSSYLLENDAARMIQDSGKQLVVHTVVTGGSGLDDTLEGFANLADQLPTDVRLVVWVNEYFGDVAADGKRFEEMRAFTHRKDRVHAVIYLDRQTSSTFKQDMEELLTAKLTFAEALASDRLGLMPRQRLKQIRNQIFDRMAVWMG